MDIAEQQSAETQKEEAPPPKPLYRLKLDHDGIYWDADEIAEAEVKEGDVVLEHMPDNTPGRYKWNAAEKRLDALPPSQVKTQPGAPSFEQAFDALVQSLEDAGHAIPGIVTAWREEFKKTLDAN